MFSASDDNNLYPTSPTRYSLNPGDGGTFPWLSSIATKFEKYEFHSVKFIYKPSCPTTTQGGCSLVAIYDPADTMPTTRAQLFNAESCIRAAIYDPMTLSLKTNRIRGEKYIREHHHGIMDAAELRTTDPGYMAALLMNNDPTATGLQFGDLFIEYKVRLIGPRVGTGSTKSAHYSFKATATSATTEGGHIGMPIGAPFALTPFNGQVPGIKTLTEKNGEFYTWDDNNTLKMQLNHNGGSHGEIAENYSTGNLTNTDMTQFKFEEPFSGLMTITSDESLSIDVNPGTRSAGAPKRASVIANSQGYHQYDTGSGNTHIQANDEHHSAIYTIVAEAGEVVDVVGKLTDGTLNWLGKVAATFTEVAPAMITAGKLAATFL